ncbi:hypothetical protein EPO05_05770 [Patescibacteria group bacterium]|nr:MAG: hypothetical protein EPO05_05770 [Patescibacteria group bacterium]
MQPNCQQISINLSEIQKLKADFDAALKNGQEDSDTTTSLNIFGQADAIQRELEIRMPIFREQLVPREFRQLIEKEEKTLSQFFSPDKLVWVPKLPKSITLELFRFWESIGFELHYLPQAGMTQEKTFPGWTEKLHKWFYEQIQEKDIAADSATLKGEWVLVDGRSKPAYQNGDQMYSNDPLAPILAKLRKKQSLFRDSAIQDYKHKGSRFNISYDELQSVPVKIALAKLLRTTPENLSLPRAIEWNFLGNAHHPEWGTTNTWELFQDKHINGDCLNGGDFDYGGFSNVFVHSPSDHLDNQGFRLMVRFPK